MYFVKIPKQFLCLNGSVIKFIVVAAMYQLFMN